MTTINKKKIRKIEIFRQIAGNYLCCDIPENWYDLEEEEKEALANGNLWQPLEYCEAEAIISTIESTVDGFIELLENREIVVEDS